MNVSEDLLREDPFASVVRPTHLVLPDDPRATSKGSRQLVLPDDLDLRRTPLGAGPSLAGMDDGERKPAELLLPEAPHAPHFTRPHGRRGSGKSLAFVASVACHLGLAYVAMKAEPLQGLAIVLPQAAPAASTRRTELLRIDLVEQPPSLPPAKPVTSRTLSDADRVARGGKVEPGDAPGHMPKLDGNTGELVYDPERGDGRPRGDPRPAPEQPKLPPASERMAAVSPRVAAPAAAARSPLLGPMAGERPSYPAEGKGRLFGTGRVAITEGDGSGAEGSVSFETSWYDWGGYASEMLRKIKWNWTAPHALYLGVKGHVRISFLILRSGVISDVRLEKSSGTSSYDEAALAAIRASSPLRPLPEDFPFEQERVTINFLYNMSRIAARQGESRGSGS